MSHFSKRDLHMTDLTQPHNTAKRKRKQVPNVLETHSTSLRGATYRRRPPITIVLFGVFGLFIVFVSIFVVVRSSHDMEIPSE